MNGIPEMHPLNPFPLYEDKVKLTYKHSRLIAIIL